MDVDYEQDQEIVRLFLQGKSQTEIAKEMKVSRQRILQRLKRNGLSGRNYRWVPQKEDVINALEKAENLSIAANMVNLTEMDFITAVKILKVEGPFQETKTRWNSHQRDERILAGKRPLIILIRELAIELGHTPRQFELQSNGIPPMTLTRYFGTISQAMRESGLLPNAQRSLSPLPVDFSDTSEPTTNLDELNKRAELLRGLNEIIPEPEGELTPRQKETSSIQYYRDPKVVAWVLQNSNGVCEFCGQQGYETDSKIAFLEIHHVIPLSEGGPDTIWNAIAVCETCHGKLHRWINREQMKIDLYTLIPRLRKNA